MTTINIPQGEKADIYTFGFDRGLKREINDESTSTVFNSVEDQVAGQRLSLGAVIAGTGNTMIAFDPSYGLWLGHTNFSSAPFKVNMQGDMNASSGVFSGTLTATGGSIGGFTINATSITDTAGVMGMSSAVTGGDDIRFWAGDATPASAEFRVTESGALTASNATITGSITASSGTIGGFTIASDNIVDAANSFGLASTVSGGDDVRFWAGDTFANRATADFRVTEAGAVTASSMTITGGSITGTPIASIPNNSSTDISLLGWQHDMAFSATDHDTVAWATGTITLSNGRTFSITGSNTGTMSAITYIYLDTGVSSTALQTTTTASTAVGANKILICVAQNVASGKDALFQVFGGKALGGVGVLLTADNITASTITTNEIAANTIVGGNISSMDLTTKTLTADTGTIAGWSMTSTRLSKGSGSTTVGFDTTVTAGDDIRIFAGSSTMSSAPFRVTEAGALTATSATITGSITSTSGTIGGFTIGSTTITATNLTLDSSGQRISLGSADDIIILDADDATYRLWIGDATAASAPFTVTKAGFVTASSITLTTSGAAIDNSVLFGDSTATLVQTRGESLYLNNIIFLGRHDDGFTEDPTVTRDLGTTYLATSGAGSADAAINGGVFGRNASNSTIKWSTYDSEFDIVMQVGTSTSQDIFWGFIRNGSGLAPDDDSVKTIDHIGFWVDDATLYATNANGTTQTKTDITSGVTISSNNYYKFVYDVGVDIKFYVNDTLKATHTTNLPTNSTAGQEPTIRIEVQEDAAAVAAKTVSFKNNYIAVFRA